MATHTLQLLGRFELTREGRPIELLRDAQRLVAFLAINGRSLPRTFAAGSLWAETSQERADGNLRSALWRVRKASRSLVRVGDQTIELADTDVDLSDLIRAARNLCSSELPPWEEIEADLSALSQRLLPDWDEQWLEVEREQQRQEALHVLEAIAAQLAESGRCDEAIRAARHAVRVDPLRESAHRCVIRIHLRTGNRSAALHQAQWFRRRLDTCLGLRPSRHLTDLVDLA